MILPDLGLLEAVLLGLAVGLSLVLLVVGVRGTPVVVGRPPGRMQRLGTSLASPGASGRLAGGVLAGVFTLLLSRWVVAAVAVAALVALWPQLFAGAAQEQLRINRLEALIIWVEGMRDTMAASIALQQALGGSYDTASPLLREALLRVKGLLAARLPMPLALMTLADDLDDELADYVIAALISQQGSKGAALRKTLDGVVLTAREDLAMRRRVANSRRELRRGSLILLGIFAAFTGFFVTFAHVYVAPYATVTGQIMLCVVLGFAGAGFMRMRQLAQPRNVPAYLRRNGEPISAAERALVRSLYGEGSEGIHDADLVPAGSPS